MRLLLNADSFEPRDAVKGDIARMLFYMDLRYAGDDGVPGLALIDDDSNSGPLLGHLCTLLARNSDDPVDDLERRRHQRMVETQGKRNPFIDRPEFSRMLPISPRNRPAVAEGALVGIQSGGALRETKSHCWAGRSG